MVTLKNDDVVEGRGDGAAPGALDSLFERIDRGYIELTGDGGLIPELVRTSPAIRSADRLVRKELIYDNVCTNVERLRSDVNRYVCWCNHRRLHSTLGYMSPVEFTQQGKTL